MASLHPQHPERPVALTRRGRIVVVALVVCALFVVFTLGRTSAKADDRTGVEVATTTTVGTGESLWAVSMRLWPDTDPREGVAALAKANHLGSDESLDVGQVLVVGG